MVLILTCSMDLTTDVVIRELAGVPVFRFNIDLWRDYRWRVDGRGYLLQDPTGRACDSNDVRAVYLRKLFFNPPRIDVPAEGSEEAWCREEVMQLWQGIHDLAQQRKQLAVVRPSPFGRWTKVRQMHVAQKFFRVPAWEMFHGGSAPDIRPAVIKTQGMQAPGGGGTVMVREVDVSQLGAAYPWFVQQQITAATHDVTVVYIAGRCFAFECSRAQFSGADCRIPTTTGQARWTRTRLSCTEEQQVHGFMQETGHHFGRLDFLRDQDGLWFLEINPNGQFAWLDPDGSEGVIKAIASEIVRVHGGEIEV